MEENSTIKERKNFEYFINLHFMERFLGVAQRVFVSLTSLNSM